MAAPTFVTEYETTDWSLTTTSRNISVTVNTGDVLVIGAIAETNNTFTTPSGGGLTYNLAQNILVSSYTAVYAWTAVAASSQTFTLTMENTAGQQWGFNVLRFSGSDGVGASSKTNVASGAPSLALTTTGDNSAIVCFNGDWNASGGARTWRTINSITPSSGNGLERSYAATGNYTIYGAYWSDAGTAGSKTTGLTAPTGQKYSIVAVEVLGSSGSATNANAENAAATAQAETPTAAVAAASEAAAATAAANDPQAAAGPNAATGSGTATAQDPSTAVTVNAECATAAAAAGDVTSSTGSDTNANAESAAAAAAAHDTSIALATLAVLADAAAIVDAAAAALGAAAGEATASATANSPSTAVSAQAECATATAAALDVSGPSARNLDLTIGRPEPVWRTGAPAPKWSTATPETRWQTGNPTT